MIPTPTPIILSGPSGDGSIPLAVWLILALTVGLQGLLFYRRRQLVLKKRAAKRHGE